jgi:hypothetical protein
MNGQSHLVWLSPMMPRARVRILDLYLHEVYSLSLAEYSLVGSFTEESAKRTIGSDLVTDGFVGSSPGSLPAGESLELMGESGSALGFFSTFDLSTTGSFSLVFALLQSSLPEGFGRSLDSTLGSGVVVEPCSFVSEEGALPLIVGCSAFVGATSFGAALTGTSKVVLDEDAAL